MKLAWTNSLAAVETRHLPPDPDVLAAIGLSHTMTSAIADLIDNSIDAGADQILIRFVETGRQLASLVVVDNGSGMDEQAIDVAMTVGKRRQYGHAALGHFGMGLKAASFSQADTLTVMSVAAAAEPVGRRWKRSSARNFECDVLDTNQVATELRAAQSHLTGLLTTGTIVRWDDVRTFPRSANRRVTDEYLSRTTQEIRFHLGLVLHRLLLESGTAIAVDVLDGDTGQSGPPQTVERVDPFGYRRSGAAGYPKVFNASFGSRTIPFEAHIWPARSDALAYRLDGRPEQHQGFYFYRRNRLLEAGNWKGAATPQRRLQLARVSIDVSEFSDIFAMNMEKSSVQPNTQFIRAAAEASAEDGTTFTKFLETAEDAYRQANQRQRNRHPVRPPGAGISPATKRAVHGELPIDSGDPISIRWAPFDGDDFFDVDRPNSTLWLNSAYRKPLLNGRRGGLNDLPTIKALLYLLTEDIFRGTFYGPRDKDNVEIWQSIITAAVQAEKWD